MIVLCVFALLCGVSDLVFVSLVCVVCMGECGVYVGVCCVCVVCE